MKKNTKRKPSLIFSLIASQHISVNIGDRIFDKVEIYDMSGKLVLLNITSLPLFNHTTIDIRGLSTGEYIIKIHTGKKLEWVNSSKYGK